MKKILLTLMSATLIFAACNKEETESGNPQHPDETVDPTEYTRITATLPTYTFQTRITINDDGKITWEDSDRFMAFDEDGNSTIFELESIAEDKTSATFYSKVKDFKAVAALYPAIEQPNANTRPIRYNTSNKTITGTLPAMHHNANEKGLLFGEVTEGNVSFRHLMGTVKICYKNLPEKFNEIRILTEEAVSGNIIITTTGKEPVCTFDNGGFLISGDVNPETKTVYLPVPAGNFKSFSIVGRYENENKKNVSEPFETIENVTVKLGEVLCIDREYVEKKDENLEIAYNKTTTVTCLPDEIMNVAGDKWFALNNGDTQSTVSFNNDCIEFNNADGLQNEYFKNPTTGGYYFKNTNFTSGVYKVTLDVKCDEISGKAKLQAVLMSVDAESNTAKYYGTKLRWEPTKKMMVQSYVELNKNKPAEWQKLSFFVDFSKYSDKAKIDTDFIFLENTEKTIKDLQIRLWSPNSNKIQCRSILIEKQQ